MKMPVFFPVSSVCVFLLLFSLSLIAQTGELRFPVQQNGKWGYTDTNGSLVIPAKYAFARDFGDGVAAVAPTPDSAALIDTDGQIVAKLPLYQSIGPDPHYEGFLVVWQDPEHQGYIDAKGKLVIPAQFTAAAKFSEGLAAVADKSGKWGWIDKTGQFVIPPQFDGGGEFKEGLARFGRRNQFGGNNWGFVDTTGKVVVEPIYPIVRDYSDGLAMVSDGKTIKRYLDKTGKTAIDLPANAMSFQAFQEGLAAVKIGNEAGFIDKTGKMVIKTP